LLTQTTEQPSNLFEHLLVVLHIAGIGDAAGPDEMMIIKAEPFEEREIYCIDELHCSIRDGNYSLAPEWAHR
jgi:hypothetical protein